jgi:ABC-2 type transport system ATP-binding protein
LTKKPAIEINCLEKKYQQTAALSSVSLAIGTGEMFGLIGPDGAGKTTLIRILTSLMDPDKGECRLLDIPVHSEPEKVRALIGYMPQRFSLYPDLTVGENLRFFADLFKVEKGQRVKRTAELLEFSRLTSFVKRRAGKLSGGMKQKLALSCALIHTPKILILDEPTTGVDPVSRREFWNILKELKDQGVSILVTTPYMDEAQRCDRIALIHKGRILATGTAEEVINTFPGMVFSVFGPDLTGLAAWLKKTLGSDHVRIVGDRVQLNVFNADGFSIEQLCQTAREAGVSITAYEDADPGLEDTFIALIAQKEKANDIADSRQ